jgi:adenylosuccinate synthase
MRAIITVGLGFGDEGKGATVDYLTRELSADLVVRYCGGAQAGHNVELPDGRRHTFSQFGAGTFAGARTYLGSRVIISPSALLPEARHLQQCGIDGPQSLLTVHPDCLVATDYHVIMNRMRETARGRQRHGSCGLGIGETRSYWLQHGLDAVVASDLDDRGQLVAKLTLLRDRFLIDMQALSTIDSQLAETLYVTSPDAEADFLISAMNGVSHAADMPKAEVTIFEGAQGVLLDEYFGFHPHTTWSTVTTQHALEMIERAGIEQCTTLGLTRTYTTRHGAGPFPTYCPQLTAEIRDRGNPENDWQGTLRAGPLDMVLLRYAAHAIELDGLVVNNLDELPESPTICRRYSQLDGLARPQRMSDQEALTEQLEKATPEYDQVTVDELLAELRQIAPIAITSAGASHLGRTSSLTWGKLPACLDPGEEHICSRNM